MNNANRQGRFTSSQMFRLVGTPAVRKTYVEEKQIEIRMKRCLDVGSYSQSMAWGKYMENQVFKKMSLDYTIVSKQTLLHPDKLLSKIWSGSPDMIKIINKDQKKRVSEVKCYYPKNFAQLTDAMKIAEETDDLAALKKINKGKEYWQVVSNAILCGVDVAEIISYMPYESEMDEIREDISNFEGEDFFYYRFITERKNDVLPVLPDGGYYKNLNIFSFVVPDEDKLLLTNCVIDAGLLL